MRPKRRFVCPDCGYAAAIPDDAGDGTALCRRCREVVVGVPAEERWNEAPAVTGICALRCPGCDGPVRPWRNRACPACGGTLLPGEGNIMP